MAINDILNQLIHGKTNELRERHRPTTIADLLIGQGRDPQENAVFRTIGNVPLGQQNQFDQQQMQQPEQQEYTQQREPDERDAYIKQLEEQLSSFQGNKPEEKMAQGLVPLDKNVRTQTKEKKKKETAAERKERIDNQKRINGNFDAYISDVNKAASAAKENDIRLKRMLKLIDSGRLNGRTWTKFVQALENSGNEGAGESSSFGLAEAIGKILGPITGTVGTLLRSNTITPETEEFEKLSTDFLKAAKNVFGNRLTNFDVSSYLKTVPTLALSDAGKKAVAKNIELFNAGIYAKQKAARDIFKEYKGVIPGNFEELIDEKAGPELDRIAEELINRPTMSPYDFYNLGSVLSLSPEEYEERMNKRKNQSLSQTHRRKIRP